MNVWIYCIQELNLCCERTHLLTVVPQAFFDKDYISSHPEDTERITHLKDLMQEQVRLSFEVHRTLNCRLNGLT